MMNCALCSVKLTIFNKSLFKFSLKDGSTICTSCIKKLNKVDPDFVFHHRKYTLDDAQKLFEKSSISPVQKTNKKVIDNDTDKTISEFKRTCKECGKVWHVLNSREQKLQQDLKRNNCSKMTANCGMCGGNYEALSAKTQTMRNDQSLTAEIVRLKQCPNCQSGNYDEETIFYDKNQFTYINCHFIY